jgi:hypothetical protein
MASARQRLTSSTTNDGNPFVHDGQARPVDTAPTGGQTSTLPFVDRRAAPPGTPSAMAIFVASLSRTASRPLEALAADSMHGDMSRSALTVRPTSPSSAHLCRVCRVARRRDKRTVVPTCGQPIGIAPSHGSLWVALGTADEVVQIDAATRRVVQRLTVPGRPTWTAFTDDSLWISQSATGDVTRIDTADATISKTIHLGKGQVPQDSAVFEGAVWVPCVDGSLAAAGKVTGPWPTNDNPFVSTGMARLLWAPDDRARPWPRSTSRSCPSGRPAAKPPGRRAPRSRSSPRH